MLTVRRLPRLHCWRKMMSELPDMSASISREEINPAPTGDGEQDGSTGQSRWMKLRLTLNIRLDFWSRSSSACTDTVILASGMLNKQSNDQISLPPEQRDCTWNLSVICWPGRPAGYYRICLFCVFVKLFQICLIWFGVSHRGGVHKEWNNRPWTPSKHPLQCSMPTCLIVLNVKCMLMSLWLTWPWIIIFNCLNKSGYCSAGTALELVWSHLYPFETADKTHVYMSTHAQYESLAHYTSIAWRSV